MRRFVQQQKLHGVILGPRASESVALAQMLDDIDCRYVRINAHASEEDVQAVVTHDRDGAAAAAGYLLSLGHRDIAVIAGRGMTVSSKSDDFTALATTVDCVRRIH